MPGQRHRLELLGSILNAYVDMLHVTVMQSEMVPVLAQTPQNITDA
jgi:hypothetical protein